MEQVLLIVVISLALVLTFVNGFHDGFNVIANSVLSRSMSPRKALIWACAASFFGPLFFGTAVATTIGMEIIDPTSLSLANRSGAMLFLLSGLTSAITWSLLTWWVGMPASSSHALVGGMVGGALAASGCGIVNWNALFFKVILILFFSPLIGTIIAYLAMGLSDLFFRGARPRMNEAFRRFQWTSLLLLGAGHGTNNAQKAMGVISMMLVISGTLKAFVVPMWAILGCSGVLVLGVSLGGWQMIGILGRQPFRIDPGHAFHAQLAAGAVILSAALLGGPVNTTQIVKSNIIGVGAGQRKRPALRILIKEIAVSWLFTVPASAILSATVFWVLSGVLGYGMGSFESIMAILGQ